MTKNNLTEAEIMKALECHKEREIDNCCFCPYFNIDGCAYELSGDAIDLLNRKNAEIEDLQIKCEHLAVFGAEAKAEIERLKADKYLYTEDGKIELLPRTDLDQIRSEAIKEVFSELENRIGIGHDILDFWEILDEIKKEVGVEL